MTGVDPEFLTLDEAARLCRFDASAPSNPANAFRKWAKRQHVPLCYRGRTILVERRILLGYLTQQDWRKRRSA